MSSKSRRTIGAKLKRARQTAGLSQRDLGHKVKLSDKAISSYEVDRAIPSLQVLQDIGKVVGKPVSYFLDEDTTRDVDLATKLSAIETELVAIREYLEKREQK